MRASVPCVLLLLLLAPAATRAVPASPLLAIVAPKPTPIAADVVAPAAAIAVDATPEIALASRLAAHEAALLADMTIEAGRREAIQDALARIGVSIRALLSTATKLDEARARERAAPSTESVDVDAAFERWRRQLPEARTAAELWQMLARFGAELRALRRQERDLIAGALAGGVADSFADRGVWSPVAVESLAAALPDAPAHAPAIVELARDVEQRRNELVVAIDALRASPAERVDRLRAERAALASRVALAGRQIDHVSGELREFVRASIARIDALATAAEAKFPPDSEGFAQAQALRGLGAEIANLLQRDLLLEQRAILHAEQLDATLRLADDTRERLSVQGATNAIGLVFVADLTRTQPPERLSEELGALRGSIADLQIRLVDLRAQILAAHDANADERTDELLARVSGPEGPDAATLATLRVRLMALVEAASQAVAAAMRGEETTLAELERRNRELRELLAGKLLWTRSHGRADIAWLRVSWYRMGHGTALAAPLRVAWLDFRDMASRAVRSWAAIAGVLLALGAWIALAWWQTRRLRDIAARGVHTLATANVSVLCALLLAAPGAWLLTELLETARGGSLPSGLEGSFASGTGWTAWTVLLLVTIAVTARARGVGQVVLAWDEPTRRALRNTAIGLLALITPSLLAVSSAWFRGDLATLNYEARAVFMAGWIGVAIVLFRVLRPGGAWPEWRGLLRRALRAALTLAALSAVVASALGYQITAIAIAHQLQGTIGVLATLLVVHGLAGIGVRLAARREAERQVVQQRLARMEGEDHAPPAPAARDEEDHGRRLVALAIAAVGVVWLAVLWAGLLPALRQLDDVVLWYVTTGSGTGLARTPVSLLDVGIAIAVAVALGVALKLVPNVLDATLRNRTRIDPGTRYAAGAILRYALTIVGVVAVFGLIGVRWSHLQWMAAALTVGLGFGLQEIFANFVSGLIVLFERQVRVGDIVTVGDVTGRVTRISTRATTVLDFDRREIMIPNKSLITDRLVNWSLTSGLTRTTVRVGVAYGTDPELVHRLLREVAAQVPKVLAKPAPLTVFTGFGRSNMEFELRAYVPSFDDREEVSNQMYALIAANFAAAGVSIDYDQVEVRLVERTEGRGGPSREAAAAAPGPA